MIAFMINNIEGEQMKKRNRKIIDKLEPYAEYFKGNGLGQQFPSPSMEKLSAFFEKKRVHNVLDFCCGTGRNSVFLAQKGFSVYGFDASRMALRDVRAKQRKANVNLHLKLLTVDGKLPYEDSFFDAIIIIRALYQARISTIRKNVEEIRRVTKPSGFVYIESNQQWVWERKRNYEQTRTNERGTYQHGRPGNYYHYFTKSELKNLFKEFMTVRFYFKDRRFYALFQKNDDKISSKVHRVSHFVEKT